MAARKTKVTPEANAIRARGYDLSTGTHGTFLRQGQTEVTTKGDYATNSPETRPGLAYYTAHKHGDPLASEQTGWHWATDSSTPTDRPVVHEVVPKPGSTIDQDPYTKQWPRSGSAAVTSNKGLDIIDTHWIPPISFRQKESGVVGIQGTLPHINWNQFTPRGSTEQTNWKELR